MTTLSQHMLEDMRVRSLSPQAQATYMLQVSLFAQAISRWRNSEKARVWMSQ
jgi:hypothetical protein